MESTVLYNILIIEDDENMRQTIHRFLVKYFLHLDEATSGASAIAHINRKVYDLVLFDVESSPEKGIEILAHLRAHAGSTPVIVLTGSRDVGLALTAAKYGAYDYIIKPFVEDELIFAVMRALDFRLLRKTAEIFERSKQQSEAYEEVIGESDVWKEALGMARRFAETDFLVYLEGELGSGKSVLANYIHRQSRRKAESYIVVDCSVIPENLIESEFFGYEQGAFAGADHSKEGLVELANGGTLFLDGICNVDVRFQQKLSKFIETKTFRRFGDNKTRTVDVRMIVASDKNLEEESKNGNFRADLWYHLQELQLHIPPLRERKGDVRILAEYFLKRFGHHREIKTLSPEASAFLESYSWPGNVRELQSVLQHAMLISKTDMVLPEDLNMKMKPMASNYDNKKTAFVLSPLHTVEKHYIESVLLSVQGNVSLAAKILEISRTTLYSRLKENGIEVPKS